MSCSLQTAVLFALCSAFLRVRYNCAISRSDSSLLLVLMLLLLLLLMLHRPSSGRGRRPGLTGLRVGPDGQLVPRRLAERGVPRPRQHKGQVELGLALRRLGGAQLVSRLRRRRHQILEGAAALNRKPRELDRLVHLALDLTRHVGVLTLAQSVVDASAASVGRTSVDILPRLVAVVRVRVLFVTACPRRRFHAH